MRNSSCTKISYPIKIADLYSGSKAIPDKLIKKKFNKFLQKVNFNNAEELYICIAMNIESTLCKNFKSLKDLRAIFKTNEDCIRFLEELIWEGEPVSPFDKTSKVYKCKDGWYKCKNTGKEFKGPVILATGHSARDVYRWLHDHDVTVEAKGLAVGVRLEHPSELIDCIQYHSKNGRGKYLPAAEYSFVQQVGGRGVYSFCMCPGGFVVPAASGPEQIVVNGMSPSNRGSKWSNSGMVVELHPEDLAEESMSAFMKADGRDVDLNDPLVMMAFQEVLEKQNWLQGNCRQTAPAQRMADFVNKRLSYDLPKTSYAPGLISSPLHFWLPSFISDRLAEGFRRFGKSSHGFLTNEAVMIAVESRTSSPVRIVRDKESLQHIRIHGLFPCGEGAGYAGGIISAGIDGERCAEAVAAYLGKG